MKKLAHFIPIAIVSAFPFYFRTVAQSYSWFTSDVGSQAALGAATILVIGGFSALWIDHSF